MGFLPFLPTLFLSSFYSHYPDVYPIIQHGQTFLLSLDLF